MALETHGRWPLVGAGALIPTTALAVEHPQLRSLAAMLWHQTEEWVWPGSFLPWINREVLGSGEDEFPVDRRVAVGLNRGLVADPAASRRSLGAGVGGGLVMAVVMVPALKWRIRRARDGGRSPMRPAPAR